MENIKEIPGYPGYGVSVTGTDAGLWTRWDFHRTRITDNWRLLSSQIGRGGYPDVQIYGEDGKRTTQGLHRLVLMAHVGPCPPGMEACHNNGIKTDVRPENLRWDTKKANQRDRYKHGTGVEGEKNSKAKLCDASVRAIMEDKSNGLPLKVIAKRHGVTMANVSYITTGKTWRHVTGL